MQHSRRFPVAALLLFIAALFFVAPAARADDNPAAPPPAPAQAPAAPASVTPAPAPAARREEAEGQAAPRATLADRVKAMFGSGDLAGLRAQLSTITGERDTARQQLATLQGQLAAMTEGRNNLRIELDAVEAALATSQNTARGAAVEIAQSTGIPAASLPVPAQGEGHETDPVAAYKAARDAGDQKKRQEIFAKHSAAIWAAKAAGNL